MKNLILLCFCGITLFLTSCMKDRHWIKGEGPIVSEYRNVKNYNGIHVAMSATVKVIKDTLFSLEVKAQSNLMPAIETRVSGSNLLIRETSGYEIRRHLPIEIIIHCPDIVNLEVYGAGNIYIESDLNVSNFKTRVSGSGNIHTKKITATFVESDIAGSGNIWFSGLVSNSADYNISGSGDINAENIEVEDVYASVSGSGSIRTWATKNLRVNISGSGNVKYKGNPMVNSSITGSGKVSRI